MMTLTDFLLARLAEDDRRAVLPSFMHTHGTHWSNRVLAECEAKRRIVEEHSPHVADAGSCVTCSAYESTDITGPPYPCPTLRLLALPYADHPDYREEWKP